MQGRWGSLMNQRMKQEKPLYTHIHENVWMFRGTLPFPQGIDFIYKLFAGKPMADVYNHPYLIEHQHWPEQPSPTMHLTEELQQVMKVAKGLTQPKDHTSGLDNTMTIIRDAEDPKRFLMYNPIQLDKKTVDVFDQKVVKEGAVVSDIVIPSRQTWQSLPLWIDRWPEAKIWHSGNVPVELLDGKPNELRHIETKSSIDFEPNEKPIFPDCNLFRIHGDDITNEHVLFHGPSGALSCTDLYHGAYNDFDPVNTWLARFWFKCQRLGNHHSKVFIPQYRKTQIDKQGDIALMQETVDALTQILPMRYLIFCHGTPPLDGQDGAYYLRGQYALLQVPEERQ